MLWHKGWLETRYRLLFALGFVGLFQVLQHKPGTTPQGIFAFVQFTVPVLVVMTYSLLAGAGVATQPSFVASKGIHGSTLFTLSLPVSRLRLMSVRAAIGWLEGIGVIGVLCCALWFLVSCTQGNGGAGNDASVCRYTHCLRICDLFRIGVAGDFSRRSVANLGHDAYLRRAVVAFYAHRAPCLPGHFSRYGKRLAADHAHHALECDRLLVVVGGGSILCGAQSLASS